VHGETFARIPERLLDRVSDRALRLYAMLDRYAGADGLAFPFRSTLAERLGCSVDSVDRALAELVAADALEVASGKATGTRNHYRVLATYRTSAAPPAAPMRQGSGTSAAPPAAPMRHRSRAIEREPTTTFIAPLGTRRSACDTCDGRGVVEVSDGSADFCPSCSKGWVA
jgi:hypothetical protein